MYNKLLLLSTAYLNEVWVVGRTGEMGFRTGFVDAVSKTVIQQYSVVKAVSKYKKGLDSAQCYWHK